MKIGKILCLAITMIVGFNYPPILAQTVNVTATPDAIPEASFIGGSTEFMYPILRGVPNEDTTAYDTLYISEAVVDELSGLNLNYLRFPGGTISQYYHFAGSHGYGTIDFDLDCRPDFINIPGFKQKVRVDKAYPGNMIEQYIDLHKWLEAEQGNSIQTLYVINIMSHFFSGDLIPGNEIIDALINSYGSDLGVLLDASPSFLNDDLIDNVVGVMTEVFNDPLIGQINTFLLEQEGFQLRAAENVAAINHLINEGISVSGIELGNENYSFTMLKDDDLSDIPYDCTTPDSVVVQYGTLTLPLRTYMQAIIKYAMITAIYDALIDELFEIPTGIVISSTQFNIDLLGLDEFQINEVKTEKYRYHEIWNKFIGSLDFYDAAIPHVYMKSQPQCEAFEALVVDSIELYGKSYIDYYFNEVLDYQLSRIMDETNNKPLWITEWNMNTANIFGNTFLHGSYVFQFMNELNRDYEDYNIELINFHNLAAWRYNQFALLRTDEDTTAGYQVNLQSVYEPFLLMGDLHKAGHMLSETDIQTWLGSGFMSSPDQYYYSYYDEVENRLILHFINQSGQPLTIPLSGKEFQVELDGVLQDEQQVADYDLIYDEAESFLSSNDGCDEYPEFYDAYTWITASGVAANVEIPGYSMGRLILQLELSTGIPLHQTFAFDILPNPSSGQINVRYTNPSSDAELIIFDITGTIHIVSNILNGSVIDIENLSDGVYFVRLTDQHNKSTGIKKLVVTND